MLLPTTTKKIGGTLSGSSYMKHLPVLYCLIIKTVAVEPHMHPLNETDF